MELMDSFQDVEDRMFECSFAHVELLSDGIVRVCVKEDIELTGKQMEGLMGFAEELCPHEKVPLLIDRQNRYALTFEAQQHLTRNAQVAAAAYVARNSDLAARVGKTYFRGIPVRSFESRASAIEWLQSQVDGTQ